MIIDIDTRYLRIFDAANPSQPSEQVCIYTLLCKGAGNDCAAYAGVSHDRTALEDAGAFDAVLAEIRRHGTKLSETEAAKLFRFEHENKPLIYRR